MSDLAIVNAYVDLDGQLVLYRRQDGVRQEMRRAAEYVTYHRVADFTPEIRRSIDRESGVIGYVPEGEWCRLQWRGRKHRSHALQEDGLFAKANLPHFEADVHPVKRFLVDSGARIQKPKRAFFDIETDSRLPFSKQRAGQARILCWSVVDEQGKVTSGVLEADTDAAERRMLLELLQHLDGFDQIVAWNGERFDFPVLWGEMRMMREDKGLAEFPFSPPQYGTIGRIGKLFGTRAYDRRKWLWLDHYQLYKKMDLQVARSGDEKQSFKLGDVATAILGDGKDRFDSSRTWDAWQCTDPTQAHNREALVRYNQKDTDLLRRIEEKKSYIALLDTICDACGVFPDSRGMRPLNQLDPFMLRLGLSRGMHFPTISRFEREDDGKKFKGALVQEPSVTGMVRDVHVVDYKSLYPSIIISWNMSPETKVPGSRGHDGPIPVGCSRSPGTGVLFRTDVRGLLPMAVGSLLDLRSEWKKKKALAPPGTPEAADADRKSNAYKVASNSFFGATGNEFSRFFDVDVAESITQAGARLIQEVEKKVIGRGWNNIYFDTDGSYVMKGAATVDRNIFAQFAKDDLNGEAIPSVLRECQCVEQRVSIAYEKEFRRILFTGVKKRYAGVYAHFEGTAPLLDSEPEIKGLEYKRGDWGELPRRLQERVLRMMLGDWDPMCAGCGAKCSHGPRDKAPKGARTAWIWKCATCGPRSEAELAFAPPVEDPEEYRKLLVRSRDYVLTAKLSRDQVKVSKAITMPLNEYSQKMRNDGSAAAQPPHVQVAKLLADRGAEVGVGDKVAYIVVDGADDRPTQAIPADDYVGQCDRFYLWEKMVWPPTERILVAAMSGTPWERMFGRVRPKKERPPLRGGAAPGQLGIFGGECGSDGKIPIAVAAVPAMDRSSPAPFRIPIKASQSTRHVLLAVRSACARFPGPRPVVVEISGVDAGGMMADVELVSNLSVSANPLLMAELRSLLG
jgi:DNA polymerase elongation subunit (family B)